MCVPVDSSALTQQLAALVALVQNQVTTPQSSNKSQKRPYAAGTPSKRLQVIDTDGSDPLGYAPAASTTSPQLLQEKANRVKQQVNKMVEGHLTKHVPSVNDFVVRTRAEILAEKKAKEQAALQDSSKMRSSPSAEGSAVAVVTPATTVVPATTTTSPTTTPSTITTPTTTAPIIQDAITEPDEASFDEGDVDDSDFRDGNSFTSFLYVELAEIDRVMGSA